MPDTFYYKSQAVFQYVMRPDIRVTLDSANNQSWKNQTVATAYEQMPVFGTGNLSRFLFSADELKSMGIDSGLIHGLKIQFNQVSQSKCYLKINLQNLAADSLEAGNLLNISTDNYFSSNIDVLNNNEYEFYFYKPYPWDGKSNLLVEFYTVSSKNDPIDSLLSTSLSTPMTLISKGQSMGMHFGGKDDYLTAPANDMLTGNKARTIEMWAKTEAFNNGGLFQAGTQSTNRDFSLRTTSSDDKWRIQLWSSDIDVTLPGSKGMWHHYALVYTSSKVILYYDGEKITEKSVSLNTGLAGIKIGRWAGSYFHGNIDEFRIWSKALTQTEIKEWMSKTVNSSHPAYSNLLLYYPMEEGNGPVVLDQSGHGNDASIHGNAWWQTASENYLNVELYKNRPALSFLQGNVYVTADSLSPVKDSIEILPERLYFRNNPASPVIMDDNLSNHPSLITDTVVVWPANNYVNTVDENGELLYKTWIPAEGSYLNKKLEWYSSTVVYEIGRFITPYGINLDLGKEGFTWMYDVTDYRDLLAGDVDFKAGNQQELLDVKFVMIKGKPARKVVNIHQLWNQGRSSYSYANLDNDVNCPPLKVKLSDNASTFKIRSRLSGHGHNSNDGSYPHCCEWKDNTHYFYIDNNRVQDWHIWREDCKLNPVFPQGGTWNGSREGWCPGDIVPEHNFEITEHVKPGDSATLDYRITPVPSNNKGMGNGRYLTSFQLVEYAGAAHNTDAGIYEIKRPTDRQLYSRINPICNDPVVIIRNAGKNDLTSLDIEYYVTGGKKLTYHWTGNLKFMETEEVILPVTGEDFWKTSGEARFFVNISAPNSKTDENSLNDHASAGFHIPDIYEDNFVIWLRTNNVPDENYYVIKDVKGNTVYSKDHLSANTTYRDTLDLPKGCYTFELFDEGYGLSYWAWPDQGTGYLKFRGKDGKSLKIFEPDFGGKIYYSFTIGFSLDIKESNIDRQLKLYPNPANDEINLQLYGLEGHYRVSVVNTVGKEVLTKQLEVTGGYITTLDISRLPKGLYYLLVSDGKEKISRQFIRE